VISEMSSRGLQLADEFAPDQNERTPEVELLIGSDQYNLVVTGRRQSITDALVAVETIFHWTLLGPCVSTSLCSSAHVKRSQIVSGDLSAKLDRLWRLDTLGIEDNETNMQARDINALNQFESSVEFLEHEERYQV